jgi:hypothetical protein
MYNMRNRKLVSLLYLIGTADIKEQYLITVTIVIEMT